MTRLLLGAVVGFTVGIVGAAALGLHAQDMDGVPVGTVEAANEAGVTVHELLGAMSTTGLGPRAYLLMTGELAPSSKPSQAGGELASLPSSSSVSGVWARLAQCESTGRWNANTGNGYYGGLQQDMTFWRNHGGLAYAPRPDLASPAAQIAVAERGLRVQGWMAWPACSRRLGLR